MLSSVVVLVHDDATDEYRTKEVATVLASSSSHRARVVAYMQRKSTFSQYIKC